MDDIKNLEKYLIGRYLQEKDISLAEVPRGETHSCIWPSGRN